MNSGVYKASEPTTLSSSDQLRLRAATPEDAGFLYRLFAANKSEEMANWGWTPEQQEHLVRLQFRSQTYTYRTEYPHATDEIVEVDAQPVGRLYLDRRPTEILIVDIAVLPEFQRRGLATTLLRIPITEVAGTGRRVLAHTAPGNTRVQRLNERLGFVKIGQEGPYYVYVWQGATVPAVAPFTNSG
jgi:ribosomal protein S18 acetylase RimI-like enzyme